MKWCVLLAATCVGASACSQGGITGKASAQAILDARLDQDLGNACEVPGAVRTIGSFADDAAASVADGTQNTGVVCAVHDNGNETFELSGEIFVGGQRWLALKGTLPASYDKDVAPKGVAIGNLRLSLSGAGADGMPVVYSDSSGECLLKYASDAEGSTGGRSWGYVYCPRAARGQLDATDATKTCTVNMQFRFENCAY